MIITDEQLKAINALNNRYIFMHDVIEAITVALQGDKNILLYGPGGHAKSEIAVEILNIVYGKGKYWTQDLGDGTKKDDLFGQIDIPALIQKQEYKRLVQHSFMAYPAAVFEEGLDTPKPVMALLKNVLTSKSFCDAMMCVGMECKTIIMCTNHVPEEWAKTMSDQATIARWPMQVPVNWPSYLAQDFSRMFMGKYGQLGNRDLPFVIEGLHKLGKFISPRDANHMWDVVNAPGGRIQSVRFFVGASFHDKVMQMLDLVKKHSLAEEAVKKMTATLIHSNRTPKNLEECLLFMYNIGKARMDLSTNRVVDYRSAIWATYTTVVSKSEQVLEMLSGHFIRFYEQELQKSYAKLEEEVV